MGVMILPFLLFSVTFGVRQRSVLFPFLFAIVDEIAFIGMYADDILLISQSVCELQSLLSKCELELAWLDMRINVAKSYCLRIGLRHNVKCANLVTRTGDKLQWASENRYLGVYVVGS